MTILESPQKLVPFKAAGMATLIGSLPVVEHSEALAWILNHTPEIPLWPQLPANPAENMLNQFIEGFPGIVEDEGRTFFNTSLPNFEEELLHFFEEYLLISENPAQLLDSRFAISHTRAEGIYQLKEKVAGLLNIKALKGQLTGPFTFLTGLSDQDHRLGYYDPTIREMAVKGLALKGAWQASFLKEQGYPVIVFIDEPALAGLGSSSFISIAKEDIAQDLSEVITAIHQASGLAGIHVCANTDWNFLLSLNLDILSFDAFGYFDRFVTSKDQIHQFLNRGGIIAWGIVPTTDKKDIEEATPDSLVRLWEEQAAKLTDSHRDLAAVLNQTLITPSCGTGSLSPELARKVLQLTRDVSGILRKKYLPPNWDDPAKSGESG